MAEYKVSLNVKNNSITLRSVSNNVILRNIKPNNIRLTHVGRKGQDGTDGREIELRNNLEYVQWRYVGDTAWINLVPLAELKGADGVDGREVLLQSNGTYIQWKYSTDVVWTNLVALVDLKGADGKSAYQIALDNGFIGTEEEWLDSLHGDAITVNNIAPIDGNISIDSDDIPDTENNRFVTDIEKSTWNSKQDALGFTPENAANKGQLNGYAELDSIGKVPSTQLPSFVDDVVEYANYASLPVTGETGKIYITLDTNKTYRWGGTSYVEISASLALGETSSTAYRGDRGKTAYDHSQLTSGNPHNVTKSDVGLGNVQNVDTTNPANITQDSTHRFTTDTEKSYWNAKQEALTEDVDYLTPETAASTYEPLLPVTPTDPEIKYLNGNRQWAPIAIGSGGYAANLYYTTIPSDIPGYYKISYEAQATETILSGVVNNNEVLFRTYLFDNSIDTNIIDSGTWSSVPWLYVSNSVGITRVKIEIFVRHTNGSETTLFSGYTEEVNSLVRTRFKSEITQSSFVVDPTDRLGARVYGTTTANANVTIYSIVGDGNASYFTTPLKLRHPQLRDFNGDPNFQHITLTQVSKLDGIEAGAEVNNISDTNATDLTDGGATTLHKHSYNNLDDKPTIPTQYTDEMAQDAVGGILVDSDEIDFTYNDDTPSLTATLKLGSIDETKLDTSVNASLDLADSALQVETDPVFSASDAAGITSTDISNWNAKQEALAADVDYLTPTTASTTYEPKKGEDDNYVTDIEKANLHAPHSDDQDLSGLVPYTGATSNIDLNGVEINNATALRGGTDTGLTIEAGASTDGSPGSAMTFKGANGGVGDTPGGDIEFTPGSGVGTGADGLIKFVSPVSGGLAAIIDPSNLTTENKTFAFPDKNGTFALTSDLVSDDGKLNIDQTTPQTTVGTFIFPQVSTPIIRPLVDSTTAIGIFKANGVTNILNADTTNSRIGINNTNPLAALDVNGQTIITSIAYPTLNVIRTSTVTNTLRSVFTATHKTSGDMVDGFGSVVAFSATDSANVENILGYFGAIRDGADNSGALVFGPYSAGTGFETMRISSSRKIGIMTSAPTHTLTLGSGADGLAYYNTTDQTTNYERIRQSWTSNAYIIVPEASGTGVIRDIVIGNTADNYYRFSKTLSTSYAHYLRAVTSGTVSNGNTGVFTTSTHSAGTAIGMQVYVGVNQSGTAGYKGLIVNCEEGSTGSGVKYLIEASIAGVTKFRVENTGSVKLAAAESIGYFLFGAINYGMTMGNSALYKYGGVQDYSVKFLMDGGTTRGWTWGGMTTNPVASLTVGGNFQTAGTISTVSTNAASSSTYAALSVLTTLSQSGTAGYTALLVNATETTTGSGAKYLIDAQVGGTSKFRVSNTGVTSVIGTNGQLLLSAVTDGGEFNMSSSVSGTLAIYASGASTLNLNLLDGNFQTGSTTRIDNLGVFYPRQATTASAPTYAKGAIYFDTTLNKLRVGGATGWETVTSA